MSTDPLDNADVLQPNGVSAAFTNDNVANLLKYVWTGVLLSTTKDEYLSRTGITSDQYDHLKDSIDPLLLVYVGCKGHCTTFKDVTYPKIVALADQVYDYADTAGGEEDSSFYANIIMAGKALYLELGKPVASQDANVISENTSTVSDLVDAQITAIQTLQSDATARKEDLSAFEEQCKADQIALNAQSTLILKKLSGENGEITNLDADITSKRKDISSDEDEYEQDVTIAVTALTYASVFPVGTIVAAVVIGVYADRAIKMKAKIDSLNTLLSTEQGQVVADRALVAGLSLLKDDLQSVIDKIGPAIEALEKMKGVWDAIANDLLAIQTAIKTKSAKGNLTVQRISQNSVVHKWDDLKNEVDNYRKAAYITKPVDRVTLDDYSRQLQAQIDKNA